MQTEDLTGAMPMKQFFARLFGAPAPEKTDAQPALVSSAGKISVRRAQRELHYLLRNQKRADRKT
jgi:hypothetical protein